MIRFVAGTLAEITPDKAIIDVGGLGYEVRIPFSVFESSAQSIGNPIKLHTSYRIRENGADLFGFTELETLTMFENLTKLNGVGPSIALAILSHLDSKELLQTIRDENEKTLTQIGGIGPQKAKKIIFEMSSRWKKFEKILGKDLSDDLVLGRKATEPMQGKQLDAVLALHDNLGFDLNKSRKSVEAILEKKPEISLEDLIREALFQMK